MLVLSRKLGEKIFIGEGPNAVEVTIVAIDGNKVRLGIVADREIPVHRGEIYDKVQAALAPFGKVIGDQLGDNRNVFMRFENKAQADAAHAAIKDIPDALEGDTLAKGSVADRGSIESMQGVPKFLRAILRDIERARR